MASPGLPRASPDLLVAPHQRRRAPLRGVPLWALPRRGVADRAHGARRAIERLPERDHEEALDAEAELVRRRLIGRGLHQAQIARSGALRLDVDAEDAAHAADLRRERRDQHHLDARLTN